MCFRPRMLQGPLLRMSKFGSMVLQASPFEREEEKIAKERKYLSRSVGVLPRLECCWRQGRVPLSGIKERKAVSLTEQCVLDTGRCSASFRADNTNLMWSAQLSWADMEGLAS